MEIVLVHNSNGKWYHWLEFPNGKTFAMAREFESKMGATSEGQELMRAFGLESIRVKDNF